MNPHECITHLQKSSTFMPVEKFLNIKTKSTEWDSIKCWCHPISSAQAQVVHCTRQAVSVQLPVNFPNSPHASQMPIYRPIQGCPLPIQGLDRGSDMRPVSN